MDACPSAAISDGTLSKHGRDTFCTHHVARLLMVPTILPALNIGLCVMSPIGTGAAKGWLLKASVRQHTRIGSASLWHMCCGCSKE